MCGGRAGYREITPYSRQVVELFPYRHRRVDVARFQCRDTLRTFSLLPCQLVPYHRYTLRSILLALVLASKLKAPTQPGLSRAANALHPDATVWPWQLRKWLGVVVSGLRRAHPILRFGGDLTQIRSGVCLSEQVLEVGAYVQSFVTARGPPDQAAVARLLSHYFEHTSRFIVGSPSQERG